MKLYLLHNFGKGWADCDLYVILTGQTLPLGPSPASGAMPYPHLWENNLIGIKYI